MKSKKLMDFKEIKFCLNDAHTVCLHSMILTFPVWRFCVFLSELELVVMPVIFFLMLMSGEGAGLRNIYILASSEKFLVVNNICKFSNSPENSRSDVVFIGSQEGEAET